MKVKNLVLLIPAALFLFSCANPALGGGESGSRGSGGEDKIVAREIALSFANAEDGVMSEATDVINTVSHESETIMTVNRTTTISTANGELNEFTWDEETKSYSKTGYDLEISNEYNSGTINSVEITVFYYTTDDCSGEPVNISETGRENIRSIKHTKIINKTVTNYKNVTRQVDKVVQLTITGVNDGVEGVKVSGSKVSSVTAVHETKSRELIITETFDQLDVVREIEDGVKIDYIAGTILTTVTGIVTKTDGRVKEIDETTTAEINRERRVTITADGSTIIVDVIEKSIIE